MTLKTFIGLSSLTGVHTVDPIESILATPLDLESNKTLVAHNTSHRDMIPQSFITLDCPENANEPCAVVDAGAKATVANLLHLLH